MQLVRDPDRLPPPTRPRLLAAGSFDGVHVGHQRVLARVRELAAARAAEAIIAFSLPPPGTPMLTPVRQRVQLLGAYEPACLIMQRHSTAIDPPALAVRLGATLLVTGDAAPDAGPVAAERVPPVCTESGVPMSAADIAACLTAGDLAGARRALGRDPAVDGRVVHGFHRGAPLGIPTANLRLRDIILPADGVYAVRVRWRDQALTGVANIGFNPTFGNRTRSVEVHLFDFAADLYGQRLTVAFVARLRGEQKFAGIDALLAQIRADCDAARAVLATADHE